MSPLTNATPLGTGFPTPRDALSVDRYVSTLPFLTNRTCLPHVSLHRLIPLFIGQPSLLRQAKLSSAESLSGSKTSRTRSIGL